MWGHMGHACQISVLCPYTLQSESVRDVHKMFCFENMYILTENIPMCVIAMFMAIFAAIVIFIILH